MKSWLIVTASVALSICCIAKDKRPNILVLISDDHSAKTLGCYNPKCKTPAIDRLAHEGVRHTRAYTTSALCVPTRYSCLTGAYASRCRNKLFKQLDNHPRIANGAFFCSTDRTIVTSLQKAGYFTGATGKWHNDFNEDPLTPKGIPKNANPRDPKVIALLKEKQRQLSKRLKRYGFDYAKNMVFGNLEYYPHALEHHNVEYTVKGAIDFLDQAPKDKPFFLWTAFTTTHGPREKIQSAPLEMTPEGYTTALKGLMKPRSEIARKNKGITSQMVAWMDEGIGVILKKLDDMGVADNTLVIFLSDQDNRGKSTPYECGANVPFIARWPKGGLKAGQVCDTLIDITDMAATFLDVANAKPADGWTIDGKSIMPVWRGETDVLKPALLNEMGLSKAVVTKHFKYIAIRYGKNFRPGFKPPQSGTMKEHLENGTFDKVWGKTPFGQATKKIGIVDPDQLYDLRKDPNEQRNLAKNPEYAKTLKEMKAYLSKYVKDIGRPFGEFGE